MTNLNKMVDDKVIALSDTEQKDFDDINSAWVNDAPNRRMTELRRQRNALLVETDYMALGDVTMSDVWKTYRQALRDITSQTPSDDELSNIKFPEKPKG